MKPGSRDYPVKLLIAGDELRELKRYTYAMAEAYGLDNKIERYQGVREISLYRWDLECLLDVIFFALRDQSEEGEDTKPDFDTLARLGDRLQREYKKAFDD